MKLSSLILSFAILLPALSQVSGASFPGLVSRQNDGQRGGGGRGNNNGAGGGGAGNTGNNNGTDAGGNTGNNANNTGGNNGGDPQTSLSMSGFMTTLEHLSYCTFLTALDPAAVAAGFANDGQDVPAAGLYSVELDLYSHRPIYQAKLHL
jgi:hypothetical protein